MGELNKDLIERLLDVPDRDDSGIDKTKRGNRECKRCQLTISKPSGQDAATNGNKPKLQLYDENLQIEAIIRQQK